MKDNWVTVTMAILGGLLVIIIGYGGFQLNRWFNFKFGYESNVRTIIEKTVKKECLR